MSKKIFITRKIPENGINLLKEKGYEIDMNMKEKIPTKRELIRFLKKKPYDAVLTLLTDEIDGDVFNAVPSAKIFANYATGFDNINLEEAKKRGITVTNTPGDFSYCVAEHTVALTLALTGRIVESDKFMREGKYKGWSPMNFIGTDLRGKTVGIIGTGRIGSTAAKLFFKGFNTPIIYYDVKRNDKLEIECNAKYFENINAIFKHADIISLHVPLLDSTRHLVNEERLSLMKPSAFLVNTSRGPVIDEKALVEILKKEKIKGAALDVLENEPLLSPGLAKLPNVILTPHIASSRKWAREDMAKIAATNIIEFLETGNAPNVVYKKL
jgi:glyoxylate reductase